MRSTHLPRLLSFLRQVFVECLQRADIAPEAGDATLNKKSSHCLLRPFNGLPLLSKATLLSREILHSEFGQTEFPSLVAQMVNAKDLGLIPGLGRSSRGGHGNPL